MWRNSNANISSCGLTLMTRSRWSFSGPAALAYDGNMLFDPGFEPLRDLTRNSNRSRASETARTGQELTTVAGT